MLMLMSIIIRREGASIVRVRDQITTCRVGGTRVMMRKEGGGLAGCRMQARGCSSVWVDPGMGSDEAAGSGQVPVVVKRQRRRER